MRTSVPQRLDTQADHPVDVHVWQFSLELEATRLAALAGTLSSDERERAAAFRFDRDRRRFIAARGLLRMLLSTHMGVPAAAVRLSYGEHGKPFIAEQGPLDLRFNLAHSGEHALLGLTLGVEIGVDLEVVRELSNWQAIAERFFAPAETAAIAELPDAERHAAFFACWTRKEAFLKAQGGGLSASLEAFEVSVSLREPARLRAVNGRAEAALGWWFHDLSSLPAYAAAIAVARQTARLTLHDRLDEAIEGLGSRREAMR